MTCSILCLQYARPSRLIKIAAGILCLLVLCCLALSLISIRLTGTGFNEAVVYHLQVGLEGAPLKDFEELEVLGGIAGASLCAIFWGFIWRSPWVFFASKRLTVPRLVPVFLAALALAINPVVHTLAQIVRPFHGQSIDIPDFKEAKDLSPLSKPVNFVWIYLESMERTYLDESIFPGLTPNLKALEAESLSFTNVRQYMGTSWTVAGMVASQCGVPLATLGGPGQSLGAFPVFLPGATCLGDLLSPLGYYLTYLGGADSNFAGKGKFYESHGFSNVRGLYQIESLIQEKERNSWGIYDDRVFDLVVQEIEQLARGQRPFGVFTLTTGTHHPKGNIPTSCRGRHYQEAHNEQLDAVHCTDYLVGQLVAKIRQIDPEILIVLSSDHLAMPNAASDLLEKGTRRNLLMLHWPSHLKPGLSDRAASTFSSGVTVLQAMGFDISALGIGRSLIDAAPTLTEIYPDFDAKVASWMDEFGALWHFADSPETMTIHPQKAKIAIGTQVFPLPTAFHLDESHKITSIAFDNPENAVDQVVGPLDDKSLVWVDACKNMFKKLAKPVIYSEGWCLWRGHEKEVKLIEHIASFDLRTHRG